MKPYRIVSINTLVLVIGLAALGGCASVHGNIPRAGSIVSASDHEPPVNLKEISQQIERADYRHDSETLIRLQASLEQDLEHTPRPGKYLYYYLGYVNYALADVLYEHTDKAERYVDASEDMLKHALKIDPDFAEAEALLGSSYGVEISLSPLKGMYLGFIASSASARALRLDPDNPRAVLLKAESDYQTPALFGGDKKLATAEFKKSLMLFDVYKAADADAPDWGKAEAYFWLAYAQAHTGDVQQARINYQAALAIEPNYLDAKKALAKLEPKDAAK